MSKIAIIEAGGKQHIVTNGTILYVEKMSDIGKVGDKITFDKVLLVDDGTDTKMGAPYISGAKVTAELIEEGRDKKVTIIRYRPKSRHFVKKGHRQPYAKVKITSVS